ncbi:MAG: hypothetical protein HRU10_13850 [Opitutales bacterium]|nr:hypothetical protein [Opitutales bacterium]
MSYPNPIALTMSFLPNRQLNKKVCISLKHHLVRRRIKQVAHFGYLLIFCMCGIAFSCLSQKTFGSENLTFLPDATDRTWTGPELRSMPVFSGNRIRVNPSDDLQSILDSAKPGDVISLSPGTYPGRLRITQPGTNETPISLIAEPAGSATLSNAVTLQKQWTHSDDLWQCDLEYAPAYVEVNGRVLQPFNGIKDLQVGRLPIRRGKYQDQVPPEGFRHACGKLYVKLFGNDEPKHVRINKPYKKNPRSNALVEYHKAADSSWMSDYDKKMFERRDGCLIQIDAPHWRIHGLKMDFAPEFGIWVTSNADNLQLSDLSFTGTLKGIYVRGADDLVVEHCDWHLFPRFQWARWAETNHGGWEAASGATIAAVFIEHYGLRHRIINNHAYEGLDLIRPRPSKSTDPKDMSEIAFNVLRNAADECIEFDSKPTLNMRVHNNFLMDAVMPLAISPVLDGRLLIDHNIVYQSTMGLRDCGLLKWYMIPSWKSLNIPTSGVTIVHNTMLNPNKAFVWTGEDHTFENILIDNNIFRVWQANKWAYKGMTLSPNNLYKGHINRLDHLEHTIRDIEPGFVSSPEFPAEPEVLPFKSFSETPKPLNNQVDFHLTSQSPSIDAGSAGNDTKYGHNSIGESSDLGALEYGARWSFPRPGPRWVNESSTLITAPLPPEIHPSWLGLNESSQP